MTSLKTALADLGGCKATDENRANRYVVLRAATLDSTESNRRLSKLLGVNRKALAKGRFMAAWNSSKR